MNKKVLDNVRFLNLYDTQSSWETHNPVILQGEIAVEVDSYGSGRLKIGSGSPFADTKYICAVDRWTKDYRTTVTEAEDNNIRPAGSNGYSSTDYLHINGDIIYPITLTSAVRLFTGSTLQTWMDNVVTGSVYSNDGAIYFKNLNTSNYMRVLGRTYYDTNGMDIMLGAGGNTVVFSGEAGYTIFDSGKTSAGGEVLILASDNQISLYNNLQAGATSNALHFESDMLYPSRDIDLGKLSKRFRNIYANSIDISGGGTIAGKLTLSRGYNVHRTVGTAGVKGYMKLATLRITATFRDYPIVLEILQREHAASSIVTILFKDSNGVDPDINKFTYYGAGMDCHLHKSSTSTWDLYVKKVGPNDVVGIVKQADILVPTNPGITITWNNDQVAELPSGSIKATYSLLASSLSTARKIGNASFDGTADITLEQMGALEYNMQLSKEADLNTIINPGEYYAAGGNTITNKPANISGFGLKVFRIADGYFLQMFIAHNNGLIYTRRYYVSGDSWSDWQKIYDSGNKPTANEIGAAAASHTHDYAASASAGGPANSALKLNTPRRIGNALFDGTADISIDGIIGDGSSSVGIPFVEGTQTQITGSWTGTAPDISSLYDGLTILYWLPYSGTGNATLNLTLKDGSTTGAVNCYYSGNSRITTHYPPGNVIMLTYRANASFAGGSTKYTGWWANADFSTSTAVSVYFNSPIIIKTDIPAQSIMVAVDNSGYVTLNNSLPVFDIQYPILYTPSGYSAGPSTTYSYRMYYNIGISKIWTFSGTPYAPLYLKGNLVGTKFTPSPTMLTCTPPTTDDGFEYLLLGTMRNTASNFFLQTTHPIFKFYNGIFQEVTSSSMNSPTVVGSSTIATSAWTVNASGNSHTKIQYSGITASHSPDVRFNKDSILEASKAGIIVYTEDGYLVVECLNEAPTVDIKIDTVIFTPTHTT